MFCSLFVRFLPLPQSTSQTAAKHSFCCSLSQWSHRYSIEEVYLCKKLINNFSREWESVYMNFFSLILFFTLLRRCLLINKWDIFSFIWLVVCNMIGNLIKHRLNMKINFSCSHIKKRIFLLNFQGLSTLKFIV